MLFQKIKDINSVINEMSDKMKEEVFNGTSFDNKVNITIIEDKVSISTVNNTYDFIVVDNDIKKLNKSELTNFMPHDDSEQVQGIRFDIQKEVNSFLELENDIIQWIKNNLM